MYYTEIANTQIANLIVIATFLHNNFSEPGNLFLSLNCLKKKILLWAYMYLLLILKIWIQLVRIPSHYPNT